MDTRDKHNAIRNVIRKITTYHNELKLIDQEIEKTGKQDKSSKPLKQREEIEKKLRHSLIDLHALNSTHQREDRKSSGGSKKRRTKKRYLRRKRSSTITRYPG